MNTEPGFLSFLDQVDPLANERRHSMLTRAYDGGYSERVAAFFKAYLAEQIPPSQRTAERLPYEQGRATPSITERDIAPRRLWRREEIARFYEDVRKGRYADREVEKLKIEREIATAARENRIADPPEQFHK